MFKVLVGPEDPELVTAIPLDDFEVADSKKRTQSLKSFDSDSMLKLEIKDRLNPEILRRRVADSSIPIGKLVVDLSEFTGPANFYCAEILAKAAIDPDVPGSALTSEQFDAMWRLMTRSVCLCVFFCSMTWPSGMAGDATCTLLTARFCFSR